MTNILVAGYYGLNNIGDEAILNGMITSLRNYIDDTKFYVLTNNGVETSSLHDVYPIEQSFKKGLKQFAMNSIMKGEMSKILKYIKSCDVFILGGGSLLQDLRVHYLPFWLSMVYYAQKSGKKTVIYGIGAGPIDTPLGKYLCKKILNNADLVTVRDAMSKNVLDNCRVENVIQTADPAFAIEIPAECDFRCILSQINLPFENNVISTTLYNWLHDSDLYRNLAHDTSDLASRREIMAGLYSEIIRRHNKNLLFVPTVKIDEEGYRIIKNLIVSHDKSYVSKYNSNIYYVLSLLFKSDLLIGARLHSLILATLMGVPIVPISYCGKVRSFLDLVGLEDLYLDIECINAKEFGDKLLFNIEEVMNNQNSYRNLLLNKSAELRTKSLFNAKLVSELL